MKKALLYSDGASSGNPGEAGIGVVLELGGRVLEVSGHIGVTTNNVAEYTALIKGLEQAGALGAGSVEAYADSELLVRQITGRYRVKDEKLRVLWEKAMRLTRDFAYFSISHIPRELNKKADGLAKAAVKKAHQRRTSATG